jgi:hypothetical protein
VGTGDSGQAAAGDQDAGRRGVHDGTKPSQGPGGQRYAEDILFAAESVYDGTWGGDTVPAELTDFELCLAFRVSWRQWKEETPLYVQRVFADLLNIRRRVQADLEERERRRHTGGVTP